MVKRRGRYCSRHFPSTNSPLPMGGLPALKDLTCITGMLHGEFYVALLTGTPKTPISGRPVKKSPFYADIWTQQTMMPASWSPIQQQKIHTFSTHSIEMRQPDERLGWLSWRCEVIFSSFSFKSKIKAKKIGISYSSSLTSVEAQQSMWTTIYSDVTTENSSLFQTNSDERIIELSLRLHVNA
ncbi:hypothetical protein TNCV_2960361 [Trichonephila clavipes]|nr:hypothetical protein TNCV_2960361 [Trichonephila clavipes]